MLKKEKMQKILENYDSFCPFELAKQLDIKISYFDFIDKIYGYYTPMLSTWHIILSKKISLEKQEKACDHLIAHHILHPGIQFCLDEAAFQQLEKKKNFSNYVYLHKKMLLT